MATFLSFDVGGTRIKYALITDKREIIEKNSTHTPDNGQEFWQKIDEIIESYKSTISGIAFSVPGRVDTEKGIIYIGGALPYLKDIHIKDVFFEKYGLPVAVVNDAKAAALAEVWHGSLKGIKDGAVIVLGTGVGGGLILDGKLRNGSHFQAGELSFLAQISQTKVLSVLVVIWARQSEWFLPLIKQLEMLMKKMAKKLSLLSMTIIRRRQFLKVTVEQLLRLS